jgi:hypothetical protein
VFGFGVLVSMVLIIHFHRRENVITMDRVVHKGAVAERFYHQISFGPAFPFTGLLFLAVFDVDPAKLSLIDSLL